MTKVTTSWDDGDRLDNKVAAMLDAYGLKGTFYIAKDYRKERLSDNEIRELSQRHEIGAHTLSHPDLRKISDDARKREIAGSKAWLETMLGKEVDMFCYPSGRYEENSAKIAKEAGFHGARTTNMGSIETGPAYEMKTTLSVYPMPFRKKDANSFDWRRLLEPLQQRAPAFRKLGVHTLDLRSFKALACRAFDIALEKGGTYHLWGHSWEVEKYGMWDELEAVCKYIAGRTDCQYVTNRELL